MDYYPLFLDIRGRRCVVIGGRGEAAIKAAQLVDYGAEVEVFAVDIDATNNKICEFADAGKLQLIRQKATVENMNGALLTVVADATAEEREVFYQYALSRGQLLNTVDDPAHCVYIVPSITRNGPVQVAVSTSGYSPAYGQQLRDAITQELESQHAGEVVSFLGERRPLVKQSISSFSERAAFYRSVVRSEVPQLVAANRLAEAEQLFSSMLTEVRDVSPEGGR